jgi:hypothetical protein
MLGLDTWRKATSRLIAVDSHLSRAAAEKRLSTLLQELNDLAIPIEGLAESVSILLVLKAQLMESIGSSPVPGRRDASTYVHPLHRTLCGTALFLHSYQAKSKTQHHVLFLSVPFCVEFPYTACG